jgi:hypothetical protein
VIAVFALALLIAFIVAPVASYLAVRSVSRTFDAARVAAAEDGDMQARLARIEDAIDAMATEIEKLSERQRLLEAPGARYSQPQPPE